MSPTPPPASPSPPAPAPAWVGWRRRSRGRWAKVAEGRTEQEASDRTFAVMAGTRGGSWDTVILPAGQRP